MTQEIIPVDYKLDRPEEEGLQIGQWYWIKDRAGYDDEAKGLTPQKLKRGQKYEWLGCVMHVGSNYVELRSPQRDTGYQHERVHFDETAKKLRRELDPESVIRERASFFRAELIDTMEEIRKTTARLGMEKHQTTGIEGPQPEKQQALAVLTTTVDVKSYKNALIKAKEKELPALFESVKETTKNLNMWLGAGVLPMIAQVKKMNGVIGEIDGRIFSISLYAGLTEEVVQCADGEPAAATEKLHVFQRRLYMDEECLLNYSAGGMEFKKIESFDRWLVLPENRDRILPFPRCIVSMRVRRHRKEREADSISSVYVNFSLEKADETTFLYIRNGDQVWRLSCAQDFGAMMFPDRGVYDESQELMIKRRHSEMEMMTRHEYEELKKEWIAEKEKLEAWKASRGGKDSLADRPPEIRMSYIGEDIYINGRSFHPGDWEALNPGTVYYDDAMKQISDEVDSYNRIVLIIQGLLDRSPVLHPHPPINLTNPDHIERFIHMVYDSTTGLASGEKPDFEEYRTEMNELITTDCLLVGHRDYWLRAEAVKENARRDRDWRRSRDTRVTRYQPDGNPGPAYVCAPTAWNPRTKKATFTWEKKRRGQHYVRNPEMVEVNITVPASELFNISAYTPGDYKFFYQDHRTRQEYIKWAPLLLAAEDYHAGKLRKQSKDRDEYDAREW